MNLGLKTVKKKATKKNPATTEVVRKPYPLDFDLEHKCSHGPLTIDQHDATNYLDPDSDIFESVFKKLTDTQRCNDMKLCASFLHTGV